MCDEGRGGAGPLAAAAPQLALVEQLRVVLRLLRDAGAEDVAARLSVEAGEALPASGVPDGLVHSMQDAAARWRAEQGRSPAKEGR